MTNSFSITAVNTNKPICIIHGFIMFHHMNAVYCLMFAIVPCGLLQFIAPFSPTICLSRKALGPASLSRIFRLLAMAAKR